MILQGNCLDWLPALRSDTFDCCVTSPPYWGLRDYGVEGQLGLERTPEEYVSRMVEVFREVRRVLKPTGTLWLNLGDSYAAHPGQRKSTDKAGAKQTTNAGAVSIGSRHVEGLKPKDLVGIPWMVAFALRADGWWLRQDIVWHKPNPMPESVKDRCTKAHEYVFLLTKSERYYYDAGAVAEKADCAGELRSFSTVKKAARAIGHEATGNEKPGAPPVEISTTRNRRSVWTVATEPTPDAHFATMPTKLVEPCILAGSPTGGLVLDPFSGAGTTGLVATKHGRRYVGIELNPEYVGISRNRAERHMGLFAEEIAS